jgi:hypothetical protein
LLYAFGVPEACAGHGDAGRKRAFLALPWAGLLYAFGVPEACGGHGDAGRKRAFLAHPWASLLYAFGVLFWFSGNVLFGLRG